MTVSANTLHTLVFVVGLVLYTVLTALGHDGNAVLVAAGGYAGGIATSKVGS